MARTQESEKMIESSVLRRAVLAGTVLQVAFAVLAHISVWVAAHALLFDALLVSALAGYLYAYGVRKSYVSGVAGGLIAGGLSGLFGASLCVVLGDMDSGQYFQDAATLVLAGGAGAVFGQFASVLKPA